MIDISIVRRNGRVVAHITHTDDYGFSFSAWVTGTRVEDVILDAAEVAVLSTSIARRHREVLGDEPVRYFYHSNGTFSARFSRRVPVYSLALPFPDSARHVIVDALDKAFQGTDYAYVLSSLSSATATEVTLDILVFAPREEAETLPSKVAEAMEWSSRLHHVLAEKLAEAASTAAALLLKYEEINVPKELTDWAENVKPAKDVEITIYGKHVYVNGFNLAGLCQALKCSTSAYAKLLTIIYGKAG